MYIFPQDNFPSGNLPMKEVSNEYLSFISLKEFLNFLKENIRNLK